MKPPLPRHIIPVLAMLASVIGCSSQPAKPETSAKPDASAAVVKDDRALTILKGMSDAVAKAQSMTFRADSAVAIASPTGQWVHVFGTSLVTLVPLRTNSMLRLVAICSRKISTTTGRPLPCTLPNEKLYATDNVPGTLDETLLQVFQKHGTYFSFADVIMSVPHDAMAKDVTTAELIGQSTVGGVLTNHLAFTFSGC